MDQTELFGDATMSMPQNAAFALGMKGSTLVWMDTLTRCRNVN